MKLKAFTLMEVLIAMGISLILIFFVYSGYLFYNREFDKKALKGRQEMDLVRFDEVLQEDFFRAEKVVLNNEVLTMALPGKLISYNFGKEFVRRGAELSTDSFKISILSLHSSFLKNSQAAADGTIDKLIVNAGVGGKEISLSYFKKYSPEQLISVQLTVSNDQ